MSEELDIRLDATAHEVNILLANAPPEIDFVMLVEQGPAGADGTTFMPATDTRFTNFVGDGNAETTVTDTPVPLMLIPVPNRTVEQGLANWWDPAASRIVSPGVWNTFRLELTMRVRLVNPATTPSLIVEINNAANTETRNIIRGKEQAVRSGMFAEISFNFDLYAGQRFFNNGGRIEIRAVGGACLVNDPRLLIKEG